MDIFEKATRKKIRFTTGRGECSVEDLWDMSLQSINNIAKAVNKSLKQIVDEEDFIKTEVSNSRMSAELSLKLEICKHIIGKKMEEADRARTRADKRAEKDFLEALLEKSRIDAMGAMTQEQIEARLKQLSGDVEEEA